MKNYENADELFESGMEVKMIFAVNKMQWTLDGQVDEKIWMDLLNILLQLNVLFQSLGILGVSFDKSLKELEGDSLTWTEKIASYENILSDMMMQTVLYREYFCVIRRNDEVAGLASHFITNLGHILDCLTRGFIPVIDTYQVENVFSTITRHYNRNAWELYFKQPFLVGLFAASKGKKIILAEGIPAFYPNSSMDCLTNSSLMRMWREIRKKYMPLSDEMEAEVLRVKKECFGEDKKKIMGVLCRGTDYTMIRPVKHAAQPSPHKMLEFVKQQMELQSCTHCYLATEDQEILKLFQTEFGDKLLYSQKTYYESKMDMLLSEYNAGNDTADVHAKNVEYLTALALLAQCDCLIAGRTSGTITTLLLAEKEYSYMHIWNEGCYGVDDTVKQESFLY